MKLLYFAWVRSKIGTGEEDVDIPAEVTTVGDLLEWLRDRGPAFADALGDTSAVRIAVNQDYARMGDPVTNADEVAVFPPVTGG